ncbi:MAG TPA: hypothetical protein VEU32_00850 [Burkholderiales bacterium]|nr:hypothetical protein [Burkholderiales bacterium]
MKTLRRLALAFVFAGCCAAVADDAHPAQQFALYSFADLYRLTVHTSPEALLLTPAASTPQIRVSMADSFAVAEPRFTVTQVPSTRGWMLLVAGLAAASWVAHRRLTSAY